MPKIAKRLTDRAIDATPIKNKDYKLYDGEGLCLLIRKSGTKVWQYPYSYNGKRSVYTIGQFKKGVAGHVSLQEARQARYKVKVLLDEGVNPNIHKQTNINAPAEIMTTFEAIALEWHSKGVWVKKHANNILSSLENDVFPYIGYKQIKELTTHDIILILSKVEERDALDVAKRICQRCEAIFDYAILKGLCDSNPAAGRAKYIKTRKTKHRPHLKEAQLPEFLNKLDVYHGREYIRYAMNLLILTFVRPGELRNSRWEEFDLDKAVWHIPAHRMKMDRDHIVPLSSQAIDILAKLHTATGNSDLLFPSVKSPHKPISDVTLTKVLRIMGYTGDVVVPHGFRHTASTILNEHRFAPDVIERQLAHKDKDKIRGTYNHAEYLAERTRMMQWYSDHMDELKVEYLHGKQE